MFSNWVLAPLLACRQQVQLSEPCASDTKTLSDHQVQKRKAPLKQVQTTNLALQKPQVDDAPHKLVTLAAACCSSSKAC